jgi:hypothetical protein
MHMNSAPRFAPLLGSVLSGLAGVAATLPGKAANSGQDWLTAGIFEGSRSYTLSNGALELTFLPQGASMASIVLRGDPDKLNPFWNPVRMNREAGRKADPSSTTGHLLCVDGFGNASPEEAQAGIPMHGEAHLTSFDLRSSRSGSTSEVTLTAKLPIVQESFTRTLRMVDGENVIYIESRLENMLGVDRPISWGEHATVGPPFNEAGVTVFDLSGSRSRTTAWTQPTGPGDPPTDRRLTSDENFTWPLAPGRDGKPVDMRQTPTNPHYTDHVTTLMDASRPLAWTTALNPRRGMILGYVFRPADYPWIMTWGSYPASDKPVRGMEFATQPFTMTHRRAVTTGSLFDTPTYQWLPAKSTLTTRFLMFYTRTPPGFTRVDDVRIENGQIVIEDRTAGKRIRLATSQQL